MAGRLGVAAGRLFVHVFALDEAVDVATFAVGCDGLKDAVGIVVLEISLLEAHDVRQRRRAGDLEAETVLYALPDVEIIGCAVAL